MYKKNLQVELRDFGVKDYKEVWDLQEELFNKILTIKINNRLLPLDDRKFTPNYLLFVEHPHVYTLGKNGSDNNLLIDIKDLKANGVSFYKIDRGGDITYHGPGQIVGYPLLDLENFSLSLHKYVYNLEESIIKTLKDYNIKASRLDGASGVWLDVLDSRKTRKICAIGIKSSRWVSMHGFAFNINTQLKYYDYINPCGFTDKKATSMQKEIGQEMNINEVRDKLKKNIKEVFQMEFIY